MDNEKMKELFTLGAFSEISGESMHPSIHSVLGLFPVANVDAVTAYLEAGETLFVFMEWPLDCFNGKPMANSLWLQTDGEWFWRNDLAYYVKTYRVGLPDQFIKRALLGWNKVERKEDLIKRLPTVLP